MVEVEKMFKQVPCKSAVELLDAISPRGEFFRGKEGAGSQRDRVDVVIFRGHSDSSYRLAHRHNSTSRIVA